MSAEGVNTSLDSQSSAVMEETSEEPTLRHDQGEKYISGSFFLLKNPWTSRIICDTLVHCVNTSFLSQ